MAQGHKDLKTCKACNFDNPGKASKCNKCGTSLDPKMFSTPYVERWKCLKCGAVNMAENNECHGCDYTKSSCFITTAVCGVLEFEDDCYELEALRKFRSDFLENSKSGGDLLENYRLYSSQIVPFIEQDCNSKETCFFLMERYIREVVDLIKRKNFNLAVQTYEDMVLYLAEKYDVKFNSNVNQS